MRQIESTMPFSITGKTGELSTGSEFPSTVATERPDGEIPADLFPLPLTPFEWFMLDDDHAHYPRTFEVVMEFEGCLLRPAFEEAARRVIQRNPLLSAIIRRRKFRWNWYLTQFPADQIAWDVPTQNLKEPRFNLRKRPGFWICGCGDETKSEVRMVFHHAVCDGHGSRRFILDWLTIYAGIVRPDLKPIPLDALDYERLRRRDEYKRDRSEPVVAPVPANPMPFSQRLRTIYEFLSQQPTPIRPGSRRRHSIGEAVAHVRTLLFHRTDVTQFRNRLRGLRFNLNDVAIAMLLYSIAVWNRAHGETGRDRLYRILVPVDLREAGDELMPAANRLSLVFITRPTSLCLDWPRLLQTIREEMDYIAEHGLQYNLVRVLPVAQSIPWLIPAVLRSPLCFSTAVLTNMGDPSNRPIRRFPEENGLRAIGNLRFVRVRGRPPLRPKTRLGMGIIFSSGEIAIQSLFDSRYFSTADADEFLRQFAEHWHQWATSKAAFAQKDGS